eukprot:750924-Hanusia_phi.AAC.3
MDYKIIPRSSYLLSFDENYRKSLVERQKKQRSAKHVVLLPDCFVQNSLRHAQVNDSKMSSKAFKTSKSSASQGKSPRNVQDFDRAQCLLKFDGKKQKSLQLSLPTPAHTCSKADDLGITGIGARFEKR